MEIPVLARDGAHRSAARARVLDGAAPGRHDARTHGPPVTPSWSALPSSAAGGRSRARGVALEVPSLRPVRHDADDVGQVSPRGRAYGACCSVRRCWAAWTSCGSWWPVAPPAARYEYQATPDGESGRRCDRARSPEATPASARERGQRAACHATPPRRHAASGRRTWRSLQPPNAYEMARFWRRRPGMVRHQRGGVSDLRCRLHRCGNTWRDIANRDPRRPRW